MIDQAPDLFQSISRRRPRAMPALSLNIAAFAERLDDLSLIEEAAFWRLYRSYWRNGELPRDPARLAAICKVSPQRWKRLAVAMELVFDLDASGRLRDPELEEQRAAALVRSEKNARNARERWSGNGAANDDANASAIASPNRPAGEGPDDASGPAAGDAIAIPPASRGQQGRKVGEDENQDFDLPSSLPSRPSRSPEPDAIGSTIDAVGTAGPYADGDADASAMAPSDAGPAAPPRTISNEDLAALLRTACKGKVAAEGLRPNGFRKVRAMMQAGFDLQAEILPALTANIGTVERLQHFGSDMVRGWVEDYRTERAARAARGPLAGAGRVFVAFGSTGWAAHEAARRASGITAPMQRVFSKEHNCQGWWFDAALPNVVPLAATPDELGAPKPAHPSRGVGPPAAAAAPPVRSSG